MAEDTAEKLIDLLAMAGTEATESVSSGVAFTVSATEGAFLYIDVALGSAGTVEVAMDFGTAGVTFTDVIPASAANAAASQKITLRVPAGWQVKITLAVATLNSVRAVID